MQHIAIFPTWNCQLACTYCSIRNSKVDRSVAPVNWTDWAMKLPQVTSRGSIVDIAGGEPLLYPGIVGLLQSLGYSGLRWAITTNGKAVSVIDDICRTKPAGGVCFNVSDHSGNPEAHESIAKLRAAGWPVNVHRVDHPSAGTHESDAHTITYQDWSGGAAVDGIRRHCTAGLSHWVADPKGDLWRCIVAMETGQPSCGNLFTGELRMGSMMCDFGCSACYTENPSEWYVEMRAA